MGELGTSDEEQDGEDEEDGQSGTREPQVGFLDVEGLIPGQVVKVSEKSSSSCLTDGRITFSEQRGREYQAVFLKGLKIDEPELPKSTKVFTLERANGRDVAGHRVSSRGLQNLIQGKVHRITETAKKTSYYPDGTPASVEEVTKVYDVFFTAGMEMQ